MKEPGWLRIEKIDMDYKQRNWKKLGWTFQTVQPVLL